ncbi:hypothetical protein H0H87_002615, partial [Tephrocybe sp. NHM501043]
MDVSGVEEKIEGVQEEEAEFVDAVSSRSVVITPPEYHTPVIQELPSTPVRITSATASSSCNIVSPDSDPFRVSATPSFNGVFSSSPIAIRSVVRPEPNLLQITFDFSAGGEPPLFRGVFASSPTRGTLETTLDFAEAPSFSGVSSSSPVRV